MIAALISEFLPYIIGAGAFLAWGVSMFFRGRASGKAKQKVNDLNKKVKQLERLNNADVSTGDGDADAEWLREFGDVPRKRAD